MAITVTVNPDTVSSAYNPIVWTCTSNDADIVRVIADVKVDGTIRASIDKDPRFGTTDTFDFDVRSVVQDYLTENIELISGNNIANAGNSEVEVQLEFYEVTLPSTVLVTTWTGTGSPSGTTGNQIWAINSALQHQETQNLNAFIVDTTSKRFLTNRTTQKIRRTETMQLHFITDEATVKAKLVEKDSSGSTISSSAFPGTAVTITDKAGIVLIDGSAMNANTATFEITLSDGGLTTDISETVTITIDEICSSEAVRLKWVNPLGGIDSYTFKARKREEIRFRSKTFEKVVEQGYALKDRGQTVLSVRGYDSMELFSDILTNTELQWIGELGLSNNVWIDDGNFVPMVVSSTKIKTIDTEKKNFQAQFKLRKANDRITHRG